MFKLCKTLDKNKLKENFLLRYKCTLLCEIQYSCLCRFYSELIRKYSRTSTSVNVIGLKTCPKTDRNKVLIFPATNLIKS